jgi:hypothetical protein
MSNINNFDRLFITPIDDGYEQDENYGELYDSPFGSLSSVFNSSNGPLKIFNEFGRKDSVSTKSSSPIDKGIIFKHNIFESSEPESTKESKVISLENKKRIKLTKCLQVTWKTSIDSSRQDSIRRILNLRPRVMVQTVRPFSPIRQGKSLSLPLS